MVTTAAALCVAAVFVATPGAAFAQWRLADGGTTCFNVITDAPVSGAAVTAPRQALQEAVSTLDTVYVDASAGNLEVGDRMEFIRNTGTVRHPVSREPFGEVVEVLAVGEIVDVNSTTALVKVVSACREVEAGDVLRPLILTEIPENLPRLPVFNPDRLVVPEETDGFIVLGAVESVKTSTRDLRRKDMTEYEMYAQRDLLVIDQGNDASWQPGDVAIVYRDRIYADSNVFREALMEPPLLGRGVIVRVEPNSAIIQLTDTVLEVQIGDRVRKVGTIWDMTGQDR